MLHTAETFLVVAINSNTSSRNRDVAMLGPVCQFAAVIAVSFGLETLGVVAVIRSDRITNYVLEVHS
jgi:hypothetical protein